MNCPTTNKISPNLKSALLHSEKTGNELPYYEQDSPQIVKFSIDISPLRGGKRLEIF